MIDGTMVWKWVLASGASILWNRVMASGAMVWTSRAATIGVALWNSGLREHTTFNFSIQGNFNVFSDVWNCLEHLGREMNEAGRQHVRCFGIRKISDCKPSSAETSTMPSVNNHILPTVERIDNLRRRAERHGCHPSQLVMLHQCL